MAIRFLNDIATKEDIQFKNSSGTNAGKIAMSGDDLIISNAVGDVLFGDANSDVYIGDGVNNVDLLFEQSGSIKGEDGGSVTLTVGSSDTTLNLYDPQIANGMTLTSTMTIGTGGTIDYTPDTGVLLKFDGQTILERRSANGAITFGHDDSIVIAGGDTSNVLNTNIAAGNETVYLGAEGGVTMYSFPNNDTTWSNRNQLQFNTSGQIVFGTAGDTNLYRSAANQLKTDDQFVVGNTLFSLGDITIDNNTPRIDFKSDQSGSNVGGRIEHNENGNLWVNAQGGKDLWLNWLAPTSPSSKADLQVGDGNSGSAILTVTGSSRRVGINDTTPSQPLDVNGNARISSDIYLGSQILHDGDTDTKIIFDTNRVRINAGGTTKFDSNNTYLTSVNNSNWSGTDLSIANGGTGASTASAARTNLGLGSAATSASTDFVAVAGDTMTGELVLDYTNPAMVFKGDDGIWYRLRVDESGNQLELGHTTNIGLKLSNSGGVTFPQLGAGFLKTNSSGAVSVDNSTYDNYVDWNLVANDDQSSSIRSGKYVKFEGADISGTGTQGDPFTVNIATGGSGTVTNVTVGTGLDVSNGTTTPSITLDLSELTDMTAAVNTSQDELILLDNGAERRKLFSEVFGSAAYVNTGTFATASHTHAASDITSGTLSDSRLSSNVATLNSSQVFTGDKEFEGNLLRTNKRVSSGQEYPLGHYTPGETVFEIDPTWSESELQAYFDNNNVTWDEVANAPGGYAIYINGSVSVGGAYGSGFPYIPIDQDGIYYMEVWIKNAGTGQGHYMGSIDYEADFTAPASGSGNPGSYGYWVMSNYTGASDWTKRSGYITGHHNNNSGYFETDATYWTPQALFNYSAGTGTRACWISGWKVIRVDQVGDRTFQDDATFKGATTFKGSIGNSTTIVPSVRVGLSSGNDPQIQFTDSGYNAHIDFGASSGQDYDVRIIHSAANTLDFQGAGNSGIKINNNIVYNAGNLTVGDGGLTQKNFTTTLKTKLDGIEAGADVTDAINVSAAGAMLKSGEETSTAMKSFETTLTNNDDWQNSPISILERGDVGAAQTDDKYAPNLNFHWGGRVSNSLWMRYNGELHWGSYSSSGVPATDGKFYAGTLYAGAGEITATKVSNWNTAYGWGDHSTQGYLTSSSTQSKYLRSDQADTATGSLTLSGGANISGGVQGSNSLMHSFFLPQNPEGSHVKAPWFFNDMAYARLRGATVSVTVNGGSAPSNSSIDAMLDASTGFWNMPTSGVTSVVIEMSNLPKTMYHGSHYGVTFGNTTWRAKDVIIETYYDGAWQEVKNVTNQSQEFVYGSKNSGSNAQTKLRWTFSNFNTTSMRIVSLFAYNYNAVGMPSLYLTKDGGEMYGDIDMGTNTITDTKVGQWDTAYGWGDHSTQGYLTSSSTQSKYLRSDTDDTATGTITIGDGSNQARLLLKKADNNTSNHIEFYNNTTRVGEIGCEDDSWLRINQETAKNIYTPRYIRADNGFYVDGTTKGINGSGNFIGGTITGASDANVSNWDTAYTHSQAAHAPSDAEANVQSDWNVTDTGSDAFIKNKPTIPTGNAVIDWTVSQTENIHADNYTDTTYTVGDGGLTQKNFTTTLKNKLDGIAASADAYVDWKFIDGADQATDIRSANYVKFEGANISGAGTSGDPYVVVTPTNSYTADGNYGMTLSGSSFRLENDRRRNSTSTDIYTGNTHDYTFYDASVGIRWYTAGAEEMRLEDDGDLHVDGDVIAFSTTVSDQRLKDDVETIENATEKVKQLRGVSYTWNDGSRKGQREIGVIAQEIEEVIPEVVHEKTLPFVGNDETYKTVDYEKLVALLIESNKELASRVETLEAKLDGFTK